MVDQDEIPDVGDCSIRELFAVLLLFAALFAAFGSTVSNYTSAVTTVPITLGLAAIALAILSVGRRISR
jgi:di/tricarboxylate transporter